MKKPLVPLLPQDVQLSCRLWARDLLHHRHTKLQRGTVTAHSDQDSHTPQYPQLTLGWLRFAPVILYWAKAYAGPGCPPTCTHTLWAPGNPSGTGSHPEHIPARAGESQCHLVGKGSIASALPPAQREKNLLQQNPCSCRATAPRETPRAAGEGGGPHTPEAS